MKYSTIIFDLDGTLLDTSQGIMRCANYSAKKMGIPELTVDQQKSFIGPPLFDSFIRECRLSENEARKAVELYRERYKEKGLYEAKHYTQIKQLLMLLNEQKYKTAVATLKRDDLAKEILNHFHLTPFIHSINGIDDQDTYSKSDIIKLCLQELEHDDLSEVVMIGDSIYDAIGAEQIGIDFIAVTYGYGFKNKEEASQIKNVFIAEYVDDIILFLSL
ncbi:HAD hydrolase-like protein [Bacillus sp. S/N-304-OC-R1]|uniref:HAD hydrolase-like protein n=1 Tax=Bacillus sp. S/N-304-OC-R1 TaxID=2758034 RepID=UPI001C8EBF9B|nr:HAD hydrolase-like protein [Bacillus sp. S/N-304-OC-R1]MBY0124249.1 HAD hydrolase-like protein [Bacillus sp. S/N-304-OC-R1]